MCFEFGNKFRGTGGPAGIGVGAELGKRCFIFHFGKPRPPGLAGRDAGVEGAGLEHGMRIPQHMGAGAAPGIFPGQLDQVGTEGIALDIFERMPAVAFIKGSGIEAIGPQMPPPLLSPIRMAGILHMRASDSQSQ